MAHSFAARAFALSTLLSAANAGTFISFVSNGTKSCPSNSPLSCQNTTTVQDLCCFNSPGGQLLQTQFWDASPATGPSDSWTIHGLWPDHCDGTFDASCDPSRAYTNISDILTAAGADSTLSYMNTYWKNNDGTDEEFWEHEWGKHGTCISTLDPTCYTDYQPTEEAVDFFETTVSLFKTLPSYEWLSAAGITPSSSQTYTSSAIQAALKAKHGQEVTLGCSSGALDEIWYHFNVQGSVVTGQFVAAAPDGTKSTCPDSGIKYLPKSGGSSGGGGSGTSTTTSQGSGPTGTSFSGKGQLNVYSGSSQNGCIISSGAWYTSGTCATFTATASGNGFTLSSSKGKCAVSNGALTCGSGTSTATVFTSTSGDLAYQGSTKFYAAATPTGSTQAPVHAGSGKVPITIVWA